MGLLDVSQALVVCALTTGIGACMYFRLSRDGAPRPWREVLPISAVAGVERGRRLARVLAVSVMTGL